MKRVIRTALFLALILVSCMVLFIGCENTKNTDTSSIKSTESTTPEESLMLQEVPQDVILYTQNNTVLDYNKVKEAIEQNSSLEDFCKKFQISQYKVYEGVPYFACKTTEGTYLVSFNPATPEYSEGPACAMEKLSFSPTENRNALAMIARGDTEEAVRNADPEGQYDFIQYSGRVDVTQSSFHYFETGEVFLITYCFAPAANAYIVIDILHLTF